VGGGGGGRPVHGPAERVELKTDKNKFRARTGISLSQQTKKRCQGDVVLPKTKKTCSVVMRRAWTECGKDARKQVQRPTERVEACE